MKKALLAVALFIFCSVSYPKELYDDFNPPEVIEQGQCMFVTLALTHKYIKQVESVFDSKEKLQDFRAYAWGFYHRDCRLATQESSIAGADLEEHIKNSINKAAPRYRDFFRKIAEEIYETIMRQYQEQYNE